MTGQQIHYASLQNEIKDYEAKNGGRIALDSPLMQQLNSAKTSAQSATVVFNNLNAKATGLGLDLNGSEITGGIASQNGVLASLQHSAQQWHKANPSAPASANPFNALIDRTNGNLKQLQHLLTNNNLQEDLNNRSILKSELDFTLPANLVFHETSADAAAYNQAYNTFFVNHKSAISDPDVAKQLAEAVGGKNIDLVKGGENEVEKAIAKEHTSIADRSLLQQGVDLTGEAWGASPSRLADNLQSELKSLQHLEASRGKMSADAYDAAYVKIMGNFSTVTGVESAQEQHTDQIFSTVQDIGRDALIAVVAMSVATATLGVGVAALGVIGGVLASTAAGGAVGFIAGQAVTAGQNFETIHEGGNVEANSGISMVTTLTVISGMVTSQARNEVKPNSIPATMRSLPLARPPAQA